MSMSMPFKLWIKVKKIWTTGEDELSFAKDFKLFIEAEDEITMTWSVYHNAMMMNNIKEVKNMMRIWKEQGVISNEINHRTIKRFNKEFYYLCLQFKDNREMSMDRLAMGMDEDTATLDDGIGYIFKSKTNRDKIHNFLNN